MTLTQPVPVATRTITRFVTVSPSAPDVTVPVDVSVPGASLGELVLPLLITAVVTIGVARWATLRTIGAETESRRRDRLRNALLTLRDAERNLVRARTTEATSLHDRLSVIADIQLAVTELIHFAPADDYEFKRWLVSFIQQAKTRDIAARDGQLEINEYVLWLVQQRTEITARIMSSDTPLTQIQSLSASAAPAEQ